MSFRYVRCTFFIGVLLLVGCRGGKPLGQVKGTVTYRGKPVPHGAVLFVPEVTGTAATGAIQADGSYTLTTAGAGDGALIGKHKVMINAMEQPKGLLPEDRNPTPPPIVPVKYTSLATTDLTAEVKAGENIIDFKLVDDGK